MAGGTGSLDLSPYDQTRTQGGRASQAPAKPQIHCPQVGMEMRPRYRWKGKGFVSLCCQRDRQGQALRILQMRMLHHV